MSQIDYIYLHKKAVIMLQEEHKYFRSSTTSKYEQWLWSQYIFLKATQPIYFVPGTVTHPTLLKVLKCSHCVLIIFTLNGRSHESLLIMWGGISKCIICYLLLVYITSSIVLLGKFLCEVKGTMIMISYFCLCTIRGEVTGEWWLETASIESASDVY